MERRKKVKDRGVKGRGRVKRSKGTWERAEEERKKVGAKK